MTKRILFLMRQPPMGSSHAAEALEAILVAGVFEQAVSVLFKDDGVWQLAGNQDSDALRVRSVLEMLRSLADYGVTNLLVCEQSLHSRGLRLQDLDVAAVAVPVADQPRLISEHDAVVSD